MMNASCKVGFIHVNVSHSVKILLVKKPHVSPGDMLTHVVCQPSHNYLQMLWAWPLMAIFLMTLIVQLEL